MVVVLNSMKTTKKSGLGRGLESLFFENAVEEASAEEKSIKIGEIFPNPNQPRQSFNEDSLNELADSIKQYGVIQPIVLRPNVDGSYMIVAGERRFRAAKLAGLAEIPAVVRELTDLQIAKISVIENLQREDLTPVEAARSYEKLMELADCDTDRLAQMLSVPRSTIVNTLRILTLPEVIINMLQEKKITQGHAKILLSGKIKPEEMVMLAYVVCEKELSVRETEQLVQKFVERQAKKAERNSENLERCREMKTSLSAFLGKSAKVKYYKGKYNVSFSCNSYEDLERVVAKLKD